MIWLCIKSLSGTYMRQLFNHHWFRQWLVAWSAPSHYLHQCWNIVNWTLWKIHAFSFKKARFKMSENWRPFCFERIELNHHKGTDICIMTYTLICTLCRILHLIFQHSTHCNSLYTQSRFQTAWNLKQLPFRQIYGADWIASVWL